jgi:hypothetical protein
MPNNTGKSLYQDAGDTPKAPRIVAFRARLDPRDPDLKRRIAEQVAALDPEAEQEALDWIERVHDGKDWTPQE